MTDQEYVCYVSYAVHRVLEGHPAYYRCDECRAILQRFGTEGGGGHE